MNLSERDALGKPTYRRAAETTRGPGTQPTLKELYEAHAAKCGFGEYEKWLLLGGTLSVVADLPDDAVIGCEFEEDGAAFYAPADLRDQWQERLEAQRKSRVRDLIEAEEREALRATWVDDDLAAILVAIASKPCLRPMARAQLSGRPNVAARRRRPTCRGKPRKSEPHSVVLGGGRR